MGMQDKVYYYTDPLAAAWMVKYFGMKICTVRGSDINFEFDCESAVWDINADQHNLCVHPDSLPLLEPKKGDILHGGDLLGSKGLRVLATADPEDIRDAKVLIGRGMVIIQRNGKQFFWPECE